VTGTELGSKIVLIADDDPTIRLLVSATLTSDQFSVLEAADGEEAWRLIREHHPAVAILDWEMPGYEGLELTAVIKGDPRLWDMTVIMLTGRTDRADREAGARAEADLYLTKPFSPQELLDAVEKALGIDRPSE
jgi:DNA-binding response OmpR family regulator